MYFRLPIISAILFYFFVNVKCAFVKRSTLRGLYVPVFTPMDESGAVNVSVIPEYAKYLKTCGIDGIVVTGTTGEGPNLSVPEKKKIFDAWVISAKRHSISIIAQIGGIPLPEMIELAKYAETIRVDALVTKAPSCYLPTPVKVLVTQIEILAKVTSLPIIYYDDPNIFIEIDIPKFFKISSGKTEQFKGIGTTLDVALQVEATTNVRVDQVIYISNYRDIAGAALMGFDSFGIAELNVFPGLIKEIISYTRTGDLFLARRSQEKLNKLVAAISALGDLSALKATMGIVTGIPVGGTRRPLPHISRKIIKEIEDILEEYGIKIA